MSAERDTLYDVVIIGSGPGGYVAAIRAGQHGLKTAIVERSSKLGGTCLHRGCIPTKAMLHTASRLHEARHGDTIGVLTHDVRLDVARMHRYKDRVVAKNAQGIAYLMKKNRVAVVHGTGVIERPGRVGVSTTGDDILAHIARLREDRVAKPRHRPAPAESSPGAGAPPTRAQEAIPAQYLPTPGPRDERRPMSPMRRLIAEQMVWSKRISAHVATFLEVDMTRIVRLRQARKADFLRTNGVKLTYMPFIMQAAVSALRAFPACNASVDGDDVLYHKDIHIGLAVALEKGLIVPVVRHADEKSFLGLARAIQDLAARARSKKLLPGEVQGGTFSITNYETFGSLGGTPVINQPQVAILGIGAIEKRPWVVEGPDGDAIAIRHIMMLSLSYDHRLVDGATGSLFLDHVKRVLEAHDESMMG